jgi:hypothetical protein
MGISSFAPLFETAGTSFARMSFSSIPDPVDGGLETFASLSLNETGAKELPCKQKSPGGLLDSDDEDESGAAATTTTTNPPNKTADYEKMCAVYYSKQHEKTASAAAAAAAATATPLDKSAPVPTAAPLDADISSGTMSTFSTFSARGGHDENSAAVPSPSPNSLNEREQLEIEYLNRGVSLAFQEFGMKSTM